MLYIGILGIVFSVCVLILFKPILTYKRPEFDIIYFLEVVKLVCFIIITIGALLWT